MSIAVAASILVGAALLIAGAAKRAAGAAWPAQATELGTPRALIPVLPWIEIVVGALLCAQVARVPLAAVAFVMLAGFTALIVARLAQGRRPPCSCFGSWRATPLGWRHVARNVVLMAAAVVAALA